MRLNVQRSALGFAIVTILALHVAVSHAQTPYVCARQWTGFGHPNGIAGVTFNGDAHIAVGINHVLVIDHDFIRVFNKCGQPLIFAQQPAPQAVLPNGLPLNGTFLINGQSIQGLFFSAGATGTGHAVIADSRVRYDPISTRFYVIGGGGINQVAGQYGVYIAISAPEDATTWPVIQYIPTTECMTPSPDPLADYMHLGYISIDATSIWITQEHVGFQMPCGFPAVEQVARMDKFNPISDYDWTVSPYTDDHCLAVKEAPDAAPHYILERSPINSTTLHVYAITADSSGKPVIVGPHPIILPTYAPPPPLSDQPLSPNTTPPNTQFPFKTTAVNRIWHASYRDGYIWASYLVGEGAESLDRAKIRWHLIQTNDWNGGPNVPQLIESGTIDPRDDIAPIKYRNASKPAIIAGPSTPSVQRAAIVFNTIGTDPGEFLKIYMAAKCGPGAFSSPVLQYTHSDTVQGDLVAPLPDGDYAGICADPAIAGRYWFHLGVSPYVQPGYHPQDNISRVGRFDWNCGMDLNGDGVVDAGDAAAFALLFGTGQPGANFQPDEQFNGDDVVEYDQVDQPQP
jgi:hypothetical protein